EEKQTEDTNTKETNNKSSVKVASNNLSKGDRGEEVKTVQDKVNVAKDGIFGKNTDKAVKNFQKDNDLSVDGIVGPKTSEKMSGTNEQATTNDSSNKEEKSAKGSFCRSTVASVKYVQASNG